MKNLILVFICILILFTNCNAVSFNDLKEDHLYFSSIKYLGDKGVIKGYLDGSYKPEKNINRAEFIKIIMESKGYEDMEGKNCFPDVKEEWYAKYICKAKELGIVKGYLDGYFRPSKNITFVEVSKVLSKIYGFEVEETDIWYKPYVDKLSKLAMIPYTVLRFSQLMNRGEIAEIIYRYENSITDKSTETFESISLSEKSLTEGAIIQRSYLKNDITDRLCTDEYDPVCGEIKEISKTGFIRKTFPNRCYAENSKAFNIIEGDCKGVSSFEECIDAGYELRKENECITPDNVIFKHKTKKSDSFCKDMCGDGICQEIVCLAEGCPCAENKIICPKDCN